MPKIGTRSVQFVVNDQRIWKNFQLSYDAEKNFIGLVPDEYSIGFESMSKTELTKFGALRRSTPRKYGEVQNIVIAKQEATVIDNMKRLLEVLQATTVSVRKVIVINFETSDQENFHRGFDRIYLDFKLGFFDEITGIGNKKIYKNEGKNHSSFDPGRRDVIIDDTPDAREFLTDVHEKFKNLGMRLEAFFGDREKMIDAFSNGLKLIS